MHRRQKTEARGQIRVKLQRTKRTEKVFRIISILILEIFITCQLGMAREAYVLPEAISETRDKCLTQNEAADLESSEQQIVNQLNMLQELQESCFQEIYEKQLGIRLESGYDGYSGNYSTFAEGEGIPGENQYIRQILNEDGVEYYQFIRDENGSLITDDTQSKQETSVNYNIIGEGIDWVVDEFGNKINFNDEGLIESIEQKKEDTEQWKKIRNYSYEKDGEGNITGISAAVDGYVKHYTGEGTLDYVIDEVQEIKAEYLNGRILKV